MQQPEQIDRRGGFLVGASVGAALAAATGGCRDAAEVRTTLVHGEVAPLTPPPGRRRAATALADELIVELASGGVDLRRLGGRWVEWLRSDGFEADAALAAALDHLRVFDAPVRELPCGSAIALAAAFPAALASASPRAMIAGAFHVARMLDPDERTALCAVAVVVAAAELLEGRRDFVAEVVAALRANEAHAELLEPIRSIPRDPRTPPAVPRGERPDMVAVIIWVLWMAHHRPRSADVLREMALGGGIVAAVGALVGGLLGARDGLTTWPQAWIDGTGEEAVLRRMVAARLG